jgi:hypothetical protein
MAIETRPFDLQPFAGEIRRPVSPNSRAQPWRLNIIPQNRQTQQRQKVQELFGCSDAVPSG